MDTKIESLPKRTCKLEKQSQKNSEGKVNIIDRKIH